MAWSNWINVPDVSGVTAGAGDVLSGKVIVDKNGNKIVGDMPDWDGVPSHINNRRIANGRYEVAVEYGRHGCYWAKNSYEYINFNELASDIGLTSDKIVSGNTICGITGAGSNIKVISKYCDISEGTWTGAKLSDSSWVALGTSSVGSSHWDYNLGETIDISKIKFIYGTIHNPGGSWIRMSRGYEVNSSTPQYLYLPYVTAFASQDGNTLYKNNLPNYMSTGSYVGALWLKDYYSGMSSSLNQSEMMIVVTNTKISFIFNYNGHNCFSMKTTTPKFAFTIGYTP